VADFSSTAPLEKYEQISLDPMIVRVQGEEESKLASLKLSYTGCENLKKQLNSQKETLENLVIQTLSDYKFESLRTEKGKDLFQKKLLTSLNQFVEGRELVRIDVVEFTEI
jgi:flagellar basal body-associated protein FliL